MNKFINLYYYYHYNKLGIKYMQFCLFNNIWKKKIESGTGFISIVQIQDRIFLNFIKT